MTGIEKRITIRMNVMGSEVEVVHDVRNSASTERHLATWILTMLATGGTGIHGFPPRGTHPEMLAPTNPLVMWAFTHLDDPRWRLSRKYLVLRQDPNNPNPQKLGSFNPHTWGAYLVNEELFVKRYEAAAPPASYPDFGCSFETFTNAGHPWNWETSSARSPRWLPARPSPIPSAGPAHRGVKLSTWTDAEISGIASCCHSSNERVIEPVDQGTAVAQAFLPAASAFVPTFFSRASGEPCRDESQHGTHECLRHVADSRLITSSRT